MWFVLDALVNGAMLVIVAVLAFGLFDMIRYVRGK